MLQLAAKRGWPYTRSLAASPDKHKYAATVNLPQTTFSMRAEAATREIAMQELCTDALYRWQHETRTPPHPQFILHDGPPFANGALHVGHFLNKVRPWCMSPALLLCINCNRSVLVAQVLKDIINRYKLLQGYGIPFFPGWDCHGLPVRFECFEQKQHLFSSSLCIFLNSIEHLRRLSSRRWNKPRKPYGRD